MRVCERVFSVGFGPGLDSMSPARSRRSASPAAVTDARLASPKTGWPGLRRGGVGGYNLHSPPPPTVAHLPRAGCIRLVQVNSFIPFMNNTLKLCEQVDKTCCFHCL